MFNQPVWYMNALVHHSWVILQIIWEALSYLMTRGIQSAIILTHTRAVGTLLEPGQCKAVYRQPIIETRASNGLCNINCIFISKKKKKTNLSGLWILPFKIVVKFSSKEVSFIVVGVHLITKRQSHGCLTSSCAVLVYTTEDE